MLGESLDCDCVCVVQNIEDSTGETSGFMRILYEWDSYCSNPQIYHPKYSKFPNDGLEEWFAKVINGNYAGGTIDEVPEPYVEAFIELNIQSTESETPIKKSDLDGEKLLAKFNRLCRETQTLHEENPITDEEIQAEINAYRRGE